MATDWTAAFEASPAGTDSPRFGDDKIRQLKSAIQERLVKEHLMDLAEGSPQPRQGLHKAGSAVAFAQAAAPTQRNGVNLAAADAGLLWLDTDDDTLYEYDGSGWVGINAATVSGYGIGVAAPVTMVTSVDNYKSGGIFYDPANLTNSPFSGVSIAVIQVLPLTASYQVQIAFAVDGGSAAARQIKTRQCLSGTWTAWVEIFTAGTDGNGGQPPAPKPTASNIQGEWVLLADIVGGVEVRVPNRGSQWQCSYFAYTVSTGTILGSASNSLILAANAVVKGTDADRGLLGFAWRIA